MTHSGWWLTCDALAVFRLTILVTQDAIFAPIRDRLKGSLHELITCAWCSSIWIAAAVTVLTKFAPGVWQYPMFGLALSAAAGFARELV